MPGELEEEVRGVSGGAQEPDQFVVSGEREEAPLQEEEPLPPLPISYGVWLLVIRTCTVMYTGPMAVGSHCVCVFLCRPTQSRPGAGCCSSS